MDDDVTAATHPQSLALDGSGTSDAEDGLVAANIDGLTGSLVPGGRRCAAIVTAILDDLLAGGAVTPGCADIAGLYALRLCIVILLREGNDAGLVVSKEFCELVDVLRCDSGLVASASDTLSETLNLARHGLGGGHICESYQDGKNGS